MDRTKIEWTDATWNPIRGCSPVSDGCRNCYAARVAHRFSGPGEPYDGLADWRGGRAVFNGTIKVVDAVMDQPLRWKRPRRIFVNSMSDLFHENVPFKVVDEVFAVMEDAHWHTFQVLTKRPERALQWFSGLEPKGDPLPNVWLGVSVEDQKAANERIPLLLACPAAVRFLSCEPLLGPVNAQVHESLAGMRSRSRAVAVDWIIAGGESGPGARPMDAAWAKSLRDQCTASGVPFLFKQWGEHDERGERVGKKAAGRLLDGRTHDEFPANDRGQRSETSGGET